MLMLRRSVMVAVAIGLSTLTARAQINPGHLTGIIRTRRAPCSRA